MSATQNNQRVSTRISQQVYKILAQAAELSGATMNQFVVQSAYEKAQEIIEKERFIRLTEQSAATFFDALENPPKPAEKLKSAVKQYKNRNRDA